VCRRAYAVSRTMTWERTAEHYMSVFESASQGHWLKVIAPSNTGVPEPRGPAAPDMQIGYLLSMCDDTGLFQHAVHSVPDRSHGYSLMTTPARCFWPAPSIVLANSRCRKS